MDKIINGFTAGAYKNKKSQFQYSRDIESNDHIKIKPFNKDEIDAIPEYNRRWAWVVVNRSAIQHNVLATKKLLSSQTQLMAIVKADAYGHGAIEVAKTAISSGASYLGVATIDEGIELRKANIESPVLLLSEPPIDAIELLLFYHIFPSIYTPDFAIAYGEIADRHGMLAPFHLAINTGMNRIGVPAESVLDFIRSINFHRALKMEGCFTHFATADSLETLDFQIQIKRFVEAINALEMAGIDPGIIHCDNSAAIYRYPKTHFDMVRLGISLYGYQPAPDTHRFVDLIPAMRVYTKITNVMMPTMSEGVSYGMNYRSPGSVKICTVPIGYADGLMRILSGKINFCLNEQAVRQVGNICMDQCMFEVDLRSLSSRSRLDPQIGDQVLIAGPHQNIDCSIDTMARRANTIQHEITIGFSKRLPRIFE